MPEQPVRHREDADPEQQRKEKQQGNLKGVLYENHRQGRSGRLQCRN